MSFLLFYIFMTIPIYVIATGVIGFSNFSNNLLRFMINFELTFLGIISLFVFYGQFSFLFHFNLFSLIILAIAAGESALGFGLLVCSFQLKKNIKLNHFRLLKG